MVTNSFYGIEIPFTNVWPVEQVKDDGGQWGHILGFLFFSFSRLPTRTSREYARSHILDSLHIMCRGPHLSDIANYIGRWGHDLSIYWTIPFTMCLIVGRVCPQCVQLWDDYVHNVYNCCAIMSTMCLIVGQFCHHV